MAQSYSFLFRLNYLKITYRFKIIIHIPNILLSFKIISNHSTVFYSKCSIFLICHIRKIGLYHSGDSIVGNQNIGLFIGLCFYFIKKIIDSLRQPECGFSTFMTACKKLLCFLEILPIPGSGLPFSKILLNQPWFHPARAFSLCIRYPTLLT